MKIYETPECVWEIINAMTVLCGSKSNASDEDFSDGGDYNW